MVRCRYSPATAVMPSTKVNRETIPAGVPSAMLVVVAWVGSAPVIMALMPATMMTCAAASSSHGLRMVRSLRSSLPSRTGIVLRLSPCRGIPGSGRAGAGGGRRGGGGLGRRGGGGVAGQGEEGRLQRGAALGQPGQRDALVGGDAADLIGAGA